MNQRTSVRYRSSGYNEPCREGTSSIATREAGALPQTPGFWRHDRTKKSGRETKRTLASVVPRRVQQNELFSALVQLSLVGLRPRRARLRFTGQLQRTSGPAAKCKTDTSALRLGGSKPSQAPTGSLGQNRHKRLPALLSVTCILERHTVDTTVIIVTHNSPSSTPCRF